MDPDTVAAYEAGARAYLEQRVGAPERAAAFAADVPDGAWRADLGCGPGHDTGALGRPVLALDAARAMLHAAPASAHRVQADLVDLPVRHGALAGAWASKCYQHLPHGALPAALADLHRAMTPDAPLALTLFAGDGIWVTGADDDFPGRLFSFWAPDHLVDVVSGAGFDVTGVLVEEGERHSPLVVWARRARSLPDHVAPGMRLLLCGLNPSLYAADVGVNYARPGNRFWPALLRAGLASVDRDPRHALRHHGVGMTDLVKRATVAADELQPEEYAAGVARVERLCAWLRPGAICLVGLAGWRAAVDRRARPGVQPRRLGDTPVYVMPSTSGLNASTQLAGFVAHLQAAAALADG